MKKTQAKKAPTKKKVAVKNKAAIKKTVTKKAPACPKCNSIFDPTSPVTILFWSGIALFFLILLLFSDKII